MFQQPSSPQVSPYHVPRPLKTELVEAVGTTPGAEDTAVGTRLETPVGKEPAVELIKDEEIGFETTVENPVGRTAVLGSNIDGDETIIETRVESPVDKETTVKSTPDAA